MKKLLILLPLATLIGCGDGVKPVEELDPVSPFGFRTGVKYDQSIAGTAQRQDFLYAFVTNAAAERFEVKLLTVEIEKESYGIMALSMAIGATNSNIAVVSAERAKIVSVISGMLGTAAKPTADGKDVIETVDNGRRRVYTFSDKRDEAEDDEVYYVDLSIEDPELRKAYEVRHAREVAEEEAARAKAAAEKKAAEEKAAAEREAERLQREREEDERQKAYWRSLYAPKG